MSATTVFKYGDHIIKIADNSGFCYGVKAALDTVYRTIEDEAETDRKIFTFGPIIHNESVITELEEKGVSICSSPEDLDADSDVIIRSHGVGREIEEKLRENAGRVIDATCPRVKRIHQLIKNADEDGYQTVIVGNAEHPEIQGVNGWCGGRAFILSSPEEVAEIPSEKPLYVVAQTTLNDGAWQKCVQKIKERFPDAVINRTICKATADRQHDCLELAKKVGYDDNNWQQIQF